MRTVRCIGCEKCNITRIARVPMLIIVGALEARLAAARSSGALFQADRCQIVDCLEARAEAGGERHQARGLQLRPSLCLPVTGGGRLARLASAQLIGGVIPWRAPICGLYSGRMGRLTATADQLQIEPLAHQDDGAVGGAIGVPGRIHESRRVGAAFVCMKPQLIGEGEVELAPLGEGIRL